jgi:hypothetical protein
MRGEGACSKGDAEPRPTSPEPGRKTPKSDRGAGQKFRVHEGPRRLLRTLTGSLKRSTSISVTSTRFRRFREGPNHA